MPPKEIVPPQPPTQGTILEPANPAAPAPPARPIPPAQPPQPNLSFNTCTTDTTEISKLPRDTIELAWPNDRATLKALTDRANAWFGNARRTTSGNTAVSYVYGRCAFEDIADAMATAVSDDHRIYIIGWFSQPWTKMKNPVSGSPPPNSLLQDYLKSTRAQVRALYWNCPVKGIDGDNKAIADFINRLPNGAAIEDAKLPPFAPPTSAFGIHHQKVIVVFGGLGLVAFLGGMDLHNSRVDVSGDQSPMHDVHVRVTGPAAVDCLNVFSQRWLDHPDARMLDLQKFRKVHDEVKLEFEKIAKTPRQPLDSVTVSGGPVRDAQMVISIGRTYPKIQKFNPKERYDFTEGEQSAWQLVANGIANARRWIYLEDQYLVSRRARAELLKKIRDKNFQFLLMLMGNSDHFKKEDGSKIQLNEFPYLVSARNEFRTDLAAIDPSKKKWGLFSLAAPQGSARQLWCGSYVHSKLWIFDDDFLVVGSANCNDRGYTYDTEAVAGITESPLERAAGGRFARDLRIALWRKHLGVPHAQLKDFMKGLQYWLKPPPTAMIYDNSGLEEDPLVGKTFIRDDKTIDYAWTHMIDPDIDKM